MKKIFLNISCSHIANGPRGPIYIEPCQHSKITKGNSVQQKNQKLSNMKYMKDYLINLSTIHYWINSEKKPWRCRLQVRQLQLGGLRTEKNDYLNLSFKICSSYFGWRKHGKVTIHGLGLRGSGAPGAPGAPR